MNQWELQQRINAGGIIKLPEIEIAATENNPAGGNCGLILRSDLRLCSGVLRCFSEVTTSITSILGGKGISNVSFEEVTFISSGPATETFVKAIHLGLFERIRFIGCTFNNVDGCRLGDNRMDSHQFTAKGNTLHNTGVAFGLFNVKRFVVSDNIFPKYEAGGELVDCQRNCEFGTISGNVIHHRRGNDGAVEINGGRNIAVTGNSINSDDKGYGIFVNVKPTSLVTSNVSIVGNTIKQGTRSWGGITVHYPNERLPGMDINNVIISGNALKSDGCEGPAIRMDSSMGVIGPNVTSGYGE